MLRTLKKKEEEALARLEGARVELSAHSRELQASKAACSSTKVHILTRIELRAVCQQQGAAGK